MQIVYDIDQQESEEGMARRGKALKELEAWLNSFIRDVYFSLGKSMSDCQNARGKLFTFGSYKLNVISPSSDVDTVFVAPCFVGREHFFQYLVDRMITNHHFSNVTSVPTAHVPLIKCWYQKIDFDILLVILNMDTIPDELKDLSSDSLIASLDEASIRSCNGCRVADLILELTPCHTRFQQLLRCIKTWATERRIYSNVLGFFGGITWALLSARITQLYAHDEELDVSVSLYLFFSTWANYAFSNDAPVSLNIPIVNEETMPRLSKNVWQRPKFSQGPACPILTPAFPAMTSTHNVSQSTFDVIMEEFRRGERIMTAVMKFRQLQSHTYVRKKMMEIFERARLNRASDYLRLQLKSKSKVSLNRVKGAMEAQVRTLVRRLEKIEGVKVRPWPEKVQSTDVQPPFNLSLCMFLGLNMVADTPVMEEKIKTETSHAINSWDQFRANILRGEDDTQLIINVLKPHEVRPEEASQLGMNE